MISQNNGVFVCTQFKTDHKRTSFKQTYFRHKLLMYLMFKLAIMQKTVTRAYYNIDCNMKCDLFYTVTFSQNTEVHKKNHCRLDF